LHNLFCSKKNKNVNFDNVKQIIELLICSGATITNNLASSVFISNKRISKEIINYNIALHSGHYPAGYDYTCVRNRIINRSNKLVNMSKDFERKKIEKIEYLLLRLPICCTDIIYQYQNTEIVAIDWSKY